MQELLNGLLPRLYPDLAFESLVFEGKNDLETKYPAQVAGCLARSRRAFCRPARQRRR